MKKWLLLISLMSLLMGMQSLRADSSPECSARRVVFGKVTCVATLGNEAMIDAYFYAATTMGEVNSLYGERLERIRETCEKKVAARQPASANFRPIDLGTTHLRIETVEACDGKRGYQEPCQSNSDCLENFCHPDRGTCSAVFTVPMTAIY